MGNSGTTGLRRVWNALFYSFAGFRSAWQNEAAFRQECVLAIILLPAAFWVGENAVQYALLAGTVLLVLITELLNSAVEAVVDRIGSEHHKLSGQAKDMGSAAVLLSLLMTGLVWAVIAWENYGSNPWVDLLR